jgi:hypothetical protein
MVTDDYDGFLRYVKKTFPIFDLVVMDDGVYFVSKILKKPIVALSNLFDYFEDSKIRFGLYRKNNYLKSERFIKTIKDQGFDDINDLSDKLYLAYIQN